MDNYADYDATGLADLVRKGDVSASELLGEALSRAKVAQEKLNCFSAVFPEVAETQISDGVPDGPFCGVPMAVKDLGFEIKGQPITNGSLAFKGNVATQNSVMCDRYKAAGFTLFGQTTSPEFGLTTTTESLLCGATVNPWDTSRTSGGSSGGASAALAAKMILQGLTACERSIMQTAPPAQETMMVGLYLPLLNLIVRSSFGVIRRAKLTSSMNLLKKQLTVIRLVYIGNKVANKLC